MTQCNDPIFTVYAEELPHDVQAFIASEGCDLVPHAINLDYSYWTAGNPLIPILCTLLYPTQNADDILQSTLPESLCDGSPTGFTITGHLGNGGMWASSSSLTRG